MSNGKWNFAAVLILVIAAWFAWPSILEAVERGAARGAEAAVEKALDKLADKVVAKLKPW